MDPNNSSDKKDPASYGPVLVACGETSVNHHLRSSLQELGFTNVTGVFTHSEALKRATDTHYSAIFFDSRKTDMEPSEFIERIQRFDEDCGLIAVADELSIDQVFGLLRTGASGFLVAPFTFDAVEQSMKYADQAHTINRELLNDPNRDATLVEITLNNFAALYRMVSLSRRSNSSFETKQMILERRVAFKEAAELAKSAMEHEEFLERISDRFIEMAAVPATRLGKVRQQLRAMREVQESEEAKKEGAE